MHAKYDIRQDVMGLEHRITYNLEAINKLVQEKFLKHKRKINSKTLPLMVWYTQCKGIETEWKLICERFPQKSLPANLVEAVDETSSYSIAVYSGVRALATGIAVLGTQQLGMEEEIKDDTIHKFLCERLHVSSSDLSAIPSMIKIEHILALYSRLSWHRSLLFITRGLDPYKELFNEGSQEEIKDEKLIKEVQDAFEIINMSSFQQQLNQLIVRIPGTLPDKSLARDILSSFSLPFTGGMEQGVLKLPPDICFRHICWLMKRAVKYKNGLN
uniref:uncharacterized protein LOC120344258 isoform X2 n=1 Tax=Styela clava TaxID=7725 RepID=UPI0019392D22|nr:uncharacterized protein LOC120344258 isoform X2 [Styela clava]